MSQVVECERCGKQLRVKDSLAGLKARCPGCSNVIQIPLEVNVTVDDRFDEWEAPQESLPSASRRFRGRRKNYRPRASRTDGARSLIAEWFGFSRWWTVTVGAFLAVIVFFMPRLGMLFLLAAGVSSGVAILAILLFWGVTILLEHPLLALQLLFFGRGIGLTSSAQSQRHAATVQSCWPLFSHALLLSGFCGLSVALFIKSPFTPPELRPVAANRANVAAPPALAAAPVPDPNAAEKSVIAEAAAEPADPPRTAEPPRVALTKKGSAPVADGASNADVKTIPEDARLQLPPAAPAVKTAPPAKKAPSSPGF
jgi:phage FluMu protein Com